MSIKFLLLSINFIFLTTLISLLPKAISQSPTCNGISISYVYNSGFQIPPNTTQTTDQPYNFQSTLVLTNGAAERLKSWRVFVGFKNREFLVSASNAVLADGTSLPANVTGGVVLAGFPVTDLMTAVETAGDFNQMQARIQLVGTEFGVPPSNISLPANVYLVNDGYLCSTPFSPGNETQVCCVKDPNATPTTPVDDEQPFETRKEGDISIMYDVISSQDTEYKAQVTISNQNPLTRLDYWQLSWDWMRGEFINSMKGAYPSVVDTNACIFGRQGEFYKQLDFSKALNCDRRPTIVDLPLDKANDAELGLVPFCCGNGTLLPPSIGLNKSISAFMMQVYKMPPDLNRTQLTPPQNWNINGTMNANYQCGPPVRVNPTRFPNPNGLTSESTAVASWQVICNIRHTKPETPKCCVSFSTFFNKSVVPCSTCACGCSTSNTCSTTAPALLLPSNALLVPFENRTKLTTKFAKDNGWTLPNPLPCADNCGVSINWHLLSDYKDGWTARMTIFNWGETSFADWFAAVELDKSMAGFENVYSFNGSKVAGSNSTLFLQGLPGLNYIVAERDGRKPKKDPRVPGSQQSVISFTKKNLPGLNVARGDGFPKKVYFNGLECAIPPILPITSYSTQIRIPFGSVLVTLILLLFLQKLF
ncbi:COBRA-like protein 7 [Rutidosis leptorrhynchoides]|uniref:COBRA-like protein 7 n=1 Tax=Rutidosis leptorrhynchoides TaxID=125765 RepID=UPI003A99E1F8